MKHALLTAALGIGIAIAGITGAAAQAPAVQVREADAQVNGVKLHYRIAGSGSPIVLIHGYAQTGYMWSPVIADLARNHTVIVPDLRGAGASDKPAGGYQKKQLANDVHALVASLGYKDATVVGHDIGLMVAYAYAAQYPEQTRRVVLMDAFLPGIGNWKDMWLLRDLWHFHFYGETPLKLVEGRERIYFEHFWNDFAADKTKSIPESARRIYAAAYAQPGGMRAGFEYFKAFEQDAADFQELAKTKLNMPVLVIAGEKSGGNFLIDQTKLVANNVTGVVIKGAGHWLMEEAPKDVIPVLTSFVQ
jgi:pimeloyl-ACP methyl ester carboxylesterase